MEDHESKLKKNAAIALRKARRCKSTSSAMPVKTTLRGGLFMSDMKGADEVFGLEHRYKAYAADRRKVLKKKDLLSSSMHESSSPTKLPKEDPLKSKTYHGFFEYHKRTKAAMVETSSSITSTTTTNPRRKAPLRAKSLDMNDRNLVARAMVSTKRNDDSSYSSGRSSSSSDDSSFTASLCSYSKEVAAQTDCFQKIPYVRGGKRPTDLQIDLLAPSPPSNAISTSSQDSDGSSQRVAVSKKKSNEKPDGDGGDSSNSSSSNSSNSNSSSSRTSGGGGGDNSDRSGRVRRGKHDITIKTTIRKLPTRSKSLDMDPRNKPVRADTTTTTTTVAVSSDHGHHPRKSRSTPKNIRSTSIKINKNKK